MNPEILKNLQVDKRLCCVCDKPLIGRSDKVFCGIQCKNKYHSDIRRNTKNAASVSTKILFKNYQILCLLLGTNCSKYTISKKELQRMGFCFEAVSGVTFTPYGIKYELFEFSWYYTKNNQIVVKLDREQSIISPFMYKRWERTLESKQTAKELETKKIEMNT
jgi:hypothetical protein